MSKLISRVAGTSLIMTVLLALPGCDQGVPLGTVEGRVTKNGQPQPGVWVHFEPQAGRPGEGRTGSNGRFELDYSQNKKGALVGRHTVRIYSGGDTDSRDNQLSPRVEVFTKEVDVTDGENSFEFEIE
jgi:hypothetical protein